MYDLTPNEIQIKSNELGYDVFPVKQENGMYKMVVWFGEEKNLGLGNLEYRCWKNGVRRTYEIIALKFGIIETVKENI